MIMMWFFLCVVPIMGFATSRKYGFTKMAFKASKMNFHELRMSSTSANDIDVTGTDARRPQVLSFTDPVSGALIKLIGCMHYNPASIKLAEELVEDAANRGVLKAVLIESCPTRWNKMVARDLKLSETVVGNEVFNNEMRTASITASKYNIYTVLGDQEIEKTTDRMKQVFLATVRDLFTPFSGGWGNIYSQFKSDVSIALPSGPEYLGSKDFLDPALLRNIPTSLFRYTSAFATKSPMTAAIALVFVFVLPLLLDSSEAATTAVNAVSTTGTGSGLSFDSIMSNPTDWLHSIYESYIVTAAANWQDTTLEFVSSVLGSALELVLVQRVFLNALLIDRNVILASNIRKICMSSDGTLGQKSVVSSNDSLSAVDQFFALTESLFGGKSKGKQVTGSRSKGNTGSPQKEVIAVLGMAHCNGIKKLLLESGTSLIDNADVATGSGSDLSAITVLYPRKE